MNLDNANMRTGTIQTVTSVEKTLKNYKLFSISKRSRSSVNLNKRQRNINQKLLNSEFSTEQQMTKVKFNISSHGRKTDKSRKNGQINFRKTIKKRGKDSFRLARDEDIVHNRNDSYESRNEYDRPHYSFAKEQFKEVLNKTVRESIFGSEVEEEKKQLFKGFYESIIQGKDLSLVEFKEIKQSIDKREIDFKQSDQHYNKIFHEYFWKKQHALVKEIDTLICSVIIIYSFE